MNLRRIVGKGFVAGLIGAVIIAVWFLIVDTIARDPFFTPAMLGSALFWGLRDPHAVQIAFQSVVVYTMIHVLAFVAIGLLAAYVTCQVERFPSTLFVVVVLFAAFEFGFYIIVALLGQPLLGALVWWNVAVGNGIAALGMGYYLWRTHPRLRERLAAHPLGAPVDESADSYRTLR
ncbi:MAG: hypothetical protein GTN62_02535 [Gemmatimonadales bacterium]|nr:hypothetical protein [Gemmatimonadales bacterium]NIN10222.1 hypothetical protein [Gemmatimonadales bacterium]NIN48978.1 hypothetical protein [Gemmatimonadales bacterium]NIP06442.1 hypothetical protein [Gemmatimonadales bacterium]NIQ98794.1 hypothetical protein [Gemmatimonadales bacterium]